jgi:hypothetical protein
MQGFVERQTSAAATTFLDASPLGLFTNLLVLFWLTPDRSHVGVADRAVLTRPPLVRALPKIPIPDHRK